MTIAHPLLDAPTVPVPGAPEGISMLTIAQVANVMNCTPQHVRNQIDRGKLRAVRFGRAVRIPSVALAEAIEIVRPAPDPDDPLAL